MTPRKLIIIGAGTIIGGIVLQQIITAAANLFFISRGPMLQQSFLELVYTLVALVGDIAVPLGAAVLGAGLALLLAARRPESPRPPAPGYEQPDHDRLD